MIDQSFSAENFEKIFNIENRKGNINKDTLPTEYIALFVRIKEIRESINELRGKYEREEISIDIGFRCMMSNLRYLTEKQTVV
jgi:hypothetical protein